MRLIHYKGEEASGTGTVQAQQRSDINSTARHVNSMAFYKTSSGSFTLSR